MGSAEVIIESGRIRGEVTDGITRFLGVPYAAAPVTERRFAAPVPHASWNGIRDATTAGPNAPQSPRPFPRLNMSPLIGSGWRRGDDYLSANIWGPSEAIPAAASAAEAGARRGSAAGNAATGAGLPVAVFIHGGAWIAGDKDAPVHDGTGFARSGVVCVAINYRLGIEGFLALPGAPINLGLRDQIAALEWVRRNAHSFGGDPDNVTVFGESAGAMCIANLIASPLAVGLFRRAIVQSGHGSMVRSAESATRLVEALAAKLGILSTVEGFRGRSIEHCLTALEEVSQPGALDLRDAQGRDPTYGLTRFLPVYGDDVLPEHPLTSLARGAGANVDLLIGTNREEMNIYLVPTGVVQSLTRESALAALRTVDPYAEAVFEEYRAQQPDASPGKIYARVLTDLVFRLPARQFAAAHQGPTYCYEFAWRSPALNGELGACHALELPFVFDTLACCTGANGIAGTCPPQTFADTVHGLWVDFMHGRPMPWPNHDAPSRHVHLLTEI
jgi:para-nitrobenzyl esterase